jgi:hypothetical protein
MIELCFSSNEATPIRRRLIYYMCEKYFIENEDFEEHYSVLDRNFEVIELWEYVFEIIRDFHKWK